MYTYTYIYIYYIYIYIYIYKHDVDTALEKGDRNQDGELDFDEVRYTHLYVNVDVYRYMDINIWICIPEQGRRARL